MYICMRCSMISLLSNKLTRIAIYFIKLMKTVDFWNFFIKETLSSARVVHFMSFNITKLKISI